MCVRFLEFGRLFDCFVLKITLGCYMCVRKFRAYKPCMVVLNKSRVEQKHSRSWLRLVELLVGSFNLLLHMAESTGTTISFVEPSVGSFDLLLQLDSFIDLYEWCRH